MKRMIFGLLAIALFGIAGPSKAHWFPTSAGWIYHSISCTLVMKKGGDTPVGGTVSCTIQPTSMATVYCAAPGNDYTFAGRAAIQPIAVTGSLADSNVVSGGGNIYTANILAFNPNLNDFIGACPNRNWTVVAVVLEQFDTSIVVTDSNGVLTSRVDASCVIPPQFQGTVPPSGTQYICNVAAQHLK